MARKTVGELQDDLKQRDKRIEELREEIDEQRSLIRRFQDNADDYSGVIERWKEAFDMTMTDSGKWTWEPFWDKHNKLVDDFNQLVRDWNRCVPLINGRAQPVGRPLLASEAQCGNVLSLHKQGFSLRGIAEETSLGLNTVRTIIAKRHGTDRTTKKHRQRVERIELDRMQLASQRRHKRTGDALPRQAQRVVEEGQELIKEAKGLGR
jgi:hypothetical protein